MLDLALDNRIFLNSELDCALQEIDMLLNTSNTELLGDPSYGTDFESFLWTLTPTTTELEDYIKEKIRTNTLFVNKFKNYVRCEFLQGKYRSIYKVKIILIDSEGNTGVREYQYQ